MSRTSVKSPDAFRTISEAADALDLPQHVLRFWETRFSQIKPMKRSGGRRYYRPTDIALLQGIRHLLYDEGYTIKGVQRILREQGIAHVAGLDQSRAVPKVASEAASPSLPAPAPVHAPTPVANPAPAKTELPVPEPPVPEQLAVEPPAPPAQPVQQIPAGPRPADSAPTAPAQPLPSFVAQHEEAHTPPAQPMISQPAIDQPVAAPTQAAPLAPTPRTPAPQTPAPQTPAPQAFPPLGSLGSPSSLRFVPDTEAAPEPAVPGGVPHQTSEPLRPLPQQPQSTHPADMPVTAPVAAQAHATSGLPRLNAQDTETLVHALRTLLDCKAILDSTRQPTPKPGSASS